MLELTDALKKRAYENGFKNSKQLPLFILTAALSGDLNLKDAEEIYSLIVSAESPETSARFKLIYTELKQKQTQAIQEAMNDAIADLEMRTWQSDEQTISQFTNNGKDAWGIVNLQNELCEILDNAFISFTKHNILGNPNFQNQSDIPVRLYLSALDGKHAGLMKFLLTSKKDINIQGESSELLHFDDNMLQEQFHKLTDYAIAQAETLMENLNCLDIVNQETPVFYLLCDCLRLVLERGANPYLKDKNGNNCFSKLKDRNISEKEYNHIFEILRNSELKPMADSGKKDTLKQDIYNFFHLENQTKLESPFEETIPLYERKRFNSI